MSAGAPAGERFDVVILGGGSAGCVLAARLSEDPARRVLLVEAGQDLREGAVPEEIASPYPGRAYFDPGWTWPGLRARMGRDGSNAGRTERPYEQARILGGGSAINGIGANRGSPWDYAEWVDAGAAGWGWEDVLPAFRKLERDAEFGGDDALHGRSGPLPIRRVPREVHSGFVRRVEAELLARGHAAGEDQNGVWQDGVLPIAVNLDERGQRASVATAYVTDAVRRRPNLAVWTETVAERVEIRDGMAVAAHLRRGDAALRVEAGLTVVSAGALHSPALLLRSGIGAPTALAAHGIPVSLRRDGVGRNLLEHPSIGVSAFLRPAARLPAGDRYHIQAILRWSSRLDGAPPGDMHMAFNARSGWHAVGHRIGTLFTWVNKSWSRGTVELASADPRTPPVVDFNLLSDPRDLERLAEAFRLAAAVLLAPSLAGMVSDPFPSTYSARIKRLLRPTRVNGLLTMLAAPAMDASAAVRARLLALAQEGSPTVAALLADEAALHAHLRRHVGGVWHPCGTCRMGDPADPLAVCDPQGRVIGVAGLAVCDASLMPTIPCANLNVPVIMVAERVAGMIAGRP